MLITSGVADRFLRAADEFNPQRRSIAVARTVVAVGTLAVVAFATPTQMFVLKPGAVFATQCKGIQAASLWCVGRGLGPEYLGICKAIAIVLLVTVASGLSPRWTCVPHAYLVFSLANSMPLASGAERAAQLATLLFIPMCLGDRRRWHWQEASEIDPWWRGASYATLLVVRLQVTVIYLDAAISKMTHIQWRNGFAMKAIANDPYFGAPNRFAGVVTPLVDTRPVATTLAWSVMIMEIGVAVLILGPAFGRRIALVLAILLHGAIALMLGLVSFSIVMVGVVSFAATASAIRLPSRRVLHDLSVPAVAEVS